MFTDPEIATVGMTEPTPRRRASTPVVGQMPVRASGRALTVNEPDGFVRVVADADEEFLLGAQIVGPEASELIAELGLAIEMGARLEDVAGTIHTHPTLAEAVTEAAAAARGEAIHTPENVQSPFTSSEQLLLTQLSKLSKPRSRPCKRVILWIE